MRSPTTNWLTTNIPKINHLTKINISIRLEITICNSFRLKQVILIFDKQKKFEWMDWQSISIGRWPLLSMCHRPKVTDTDQMRTNRDENDFTKEMFVYSIDAMRNLIRILWLNIKRVLVRVNWVVSLCSLSSLLRHEYFVHFHRFSAHNICLSFNSGHWTKSNDKIDSTQALFGFFAKVKNVREWVFCRFYLLNFCFAHFSLVFLIFFSLFFASFDRMWKQMYCQPIKYLPLLTAIGQIIQLKMTEKFGVVMFMTVLKSWWRSEW